MNAQGNSYLANQINTTSKRHNGSRLGDRTMFAHLVDGKRYFSSLDAEIFFGETYIDDIVQINWSIEQATMPLFGYNSYTFDDLAIGARQITGSFVVNFTKSGFMYDVLRNVQAISRNSFRSTVDATESSKLSWASHFDKEHNAAWDRSFNIRVGYGDYTQKGGHSTMIVLYCVQLTGCQQVLSTDGGVIGEVYSFIAKDIRYDMESLPEKTLEQTNGNDSNQDSSQKEFVFAVNNLIIEKNSTNDMFNIRLESTCTGGTITSIKAKLKEDNMTAISTVPVDLGEECNSVTNIPKSNNTQIKNCIEKQIKMGVKEDDVAMYIDLIINYSIDGTPKLALFKNNIKVKVANMNAQ